MGGDLDGAIALYDRYLAEAPGAGDAERVRKAVEKLRKKEIGGQVDDTAGGSATGAQGGEQPITATGDDGATQWFDRAQTQYAAGKYEDAVQSFGKAFELSPKPEFVYNQGAALEKQGRAAAAAAAYEHYLALAPEAKDYARVAKLTKKLREQAASDPIADPWADEAAGTDPTATGKEGAQQWFDKAQAAYMVGDYPAAHAGFMHAYKELPRPEFLYNAGAALDMGGDATGAVALYERYLAEKPGASDAAKVQKRIAKLKAKAAGGAEPGAEGGEPPIEETGKEGARKWFARGEQQFRAAKYEEAVHSFGTAFELEPSPAYVYDQGMALEKQGRPAAAAAAYERYLALKPDAKNHDDVVDKVKKLLGSGGRRPDRRPVGRRGRRPRPGRRGQGRRQAVVREGRGVLPGRLVRAGARWIHARLRAMAPRRVPVRCREGPRRGGRRRRCDRALQALSLRSRRRQGRGEGTEADRRAGAEGERRRRADRSVTLERPYFRRSDSSRRGWKSD